ncbi:YedE family putative selenium transporter [Tepidibacter aestuarii]|uniref:YedE family putative selenium transporter n=1 Tax=Tepidibacter aestuarii TaxID=2925782 RepID=UPI0020BD6F2D|nr:YedE family putative selenium transporter [Tepidibacter aestuarii]CAH2212166.1 Sulf_transp domain-containing protein [Tepidibacter aestuarii]
MESKKGIIFTGAIVGIIAVLLVKLGNPKNMGFCIACFVRDISGGLGFHRAAVVQYLRPEVMGLVLGSFAVASLKKEFNVKGGSSPFIRFTLGVTVMIGALMFLGCPLRMVLRLAGGDLNAIVGIIGFTFGIILGIASLNKGFSLKRNYKLPKSEGYIFPIMNIFLVILLISAPSFIFFSEEGPGAMHAPALIALACGLIVGILSQRTRLCMVGGIRDLILFKDTYLISGFIAILVFALIGNIALGYFNIGFEAQPIAHSDGLWNFLGMVLCGWSSVLLGGCPMRQLILSGEGNTDSAITVMGLLIGAAICHNFALAASPKGPSPNGKIAVIVCLLVVGLISYLNSDMVNLKSKGKGVA